MREISTCTLRRDNRISVLVQLEERQVNVQEAIKEL
ncbi:hypothetical protein PIIN_10802 [Serendipita indica DSM 11827]|uniref:Uncharacterized protein n=1 Tax=Serendipita indica (strain DSM 11827) TaxID=1109443 RepID=G4TZS3_SERID|nr:hypothetical protein PIIN_10802 [Serendipita indica DSM 11827]